MMTSTSMKGTPVMLADRIEAAVVVNVPMLALSSVCPVLAVLCVRGSEDWQENPQPHTTTRK